MILRILIILFILSGCSNKNKSRSERYFQEKWCEELHGRIEVRMSDNTRCDCLTEEYAIEFDFAKKWAEAPGQALNYARLTGKKAGIVIICKSSRDLKKLFILKKNIEFYKLPITLWSINCE